MRVKLGFFAILFFFGIFSPLMGQDTLTVMSYNIYHAENPETSESTLQNIADFIIRIQPDFVALQEVDNQTKRLAKINDGRSFSLADSLAQLTSMQAYFGTTIDFDGGEYGLAILSEKYFNSQKSELPNPQKGEPRVMLYLNAQTTSGREIIFANTHLDHQSRKNRLAQTEKVKGALLKQAMPVILAGDFNFTPDSQEYSLMKSQWIDTAVEIQRSPQLTYPHKNPTKRIDYIFLSSNTQWKAIDFKTYNLPYSDHRPIVATVVLERAD